MYVENPHLDDTPSAAAGGGRVDDPKLAASINAEPTDLVLNVAKPHRPTARVAQEQLVGAAVGETPARLVGVALLGGLVDGLGLAAHLEHRLLGVGAAGATVEVARLVESHARDCKDRCGANYLVGARLGD